MADAGNIDVVELPLFSATQHPAAAQILERQLYRWWPPAELVQKLPAHYSIALECWRCRDGVRRFSPANPRECDFSTYTFYDATAFALEASIGGRALLWHRDKQVPCPWLSFDEARLFLQYAQHLREHLGTTRKLADSLNVCVAARHSVGEKDILPAEIGLDHRGSGRRWTVGRLKEEGRRAALVRRIDAPTESEIVRLGLIAAAEIDPLDISDSESEFITRSVIFRMNSGLPKPSEEVLSFVATQVTKSIAKKVDVSDEEFRKWIEDPHSNLIRSIQRASRDELDRNQIKAALLELAWYSVKALGKSVDELMRTIRESIAESFTLEENFLYEQIYLANPVFSELPLILLHDRMQFLNEVVPSYWLASNDDRSIRNIRTMLYYYGVIVGNLRDSDALYKRRALSRSVSNSSGREEQLFDHALAASMPPVIEVLYDAIRELAVEQGLICQNDADDWSVNLVSWDEANVVAEVCDPTGKKVKVLTVDRSTFDHFVRDASLE